MPCRWLSFSQSWCDGNWVASESHLGQSSDFMAGPVARFLSHFGCQNCTTLSESCQISFGPSVKLVWVVRNATAALAPGPLAACVAWEKACDRLDDKAFERVSLKKKKSEKKRESWASRWLPKRWTYLSAFFDDDKMLDDQTDAPDGQWTLTVTRNLFNILICLTSKGSTSTYKSEREIHACQPPKHIS